MRRNPKSVGRMVLAALVAATLAMLGACGDSGGVGGVQSADQDTSTSGGQPDSSADAGQSSGADAGQSSGADAGQGSDSAAVTLKYWTWFPPGNTLKQLIAAYEKDNPNVTIDLHQFAGADYRKSAILALTSGKQIDILGVQIQAMTKDVRSSVRPVKEWADQLPDGWKSKLSARDIKLTEDAATDGTLYELPMGSMGSVVMFYNAAMLDDLGITPPKTAAELADAAKKIRAAKPDVTPAVFIGTPYWQLEMLWTIISQTHPKLSDDVEFGDTPWTDPAVIQGITDYQKMFTDGAFDVSTLSLKAPRPVELFGTGKAAFLFDGSWRSSLLSADYRKQNDLKVSDVGALPFPVVHDDGTPAVRTNTEGGLAIPKSSTHVKEAAKFIAWMTMGKGVDIWGRQLLLVPSKKGFTVPEGALASPAAKAGYSAIQSVLGKPSSTRISVVGFKDYAGNALLDVLNGNQGPEDAAKSIQEEWTSGRYPHGKDK